MGFIFRKQRSAGGDNLMAQDWGNETWLHRYETDPGMTWANQQSSTATFGSGGLAFDGDPAYAGVNGIWHDTPAIPASGDWAYVSEVSITGINHDDAIIGQAATLGGTQASPTLLFHNGYYFDAITGPGYKANTWTSYTAGFSLIGEHYPSTNTPGSFQRVYLVTAWDDSAGKLFGGMFGGYLMSKGGTMDGLNDLGVQTKPNNLGFVAGANAAGKCGMQVHMSKLVPVADASTWPIPELIGR